MTPPVNIGQSSATPELALMAKWMEYKMDMDPAV